MHALKDPHRKATDDHSNGSSVLNVGQNHANTGEIDDDVVLYAILKSVNLVWPLTAANPILDSP